jgi:hypothetical protein
MLLGIGLLGALLLAAAALPFTTSYAIGETCGFPIGLTPSVRQLAHSQSRQHIRRWDCWKTSDSFITHPCPSASPSREGRELRRQLVGLQYVAARFDQGKIIAISQVGGLPYRCCLRA